MNETLISVHGYHLIGARHTLVRTDFLDGTSISRKNSSNVTP